jgi:hypothetical protein
VRWRVNTARGPIVDDLALHRALSEGWIAGAGLDDIEEEPAKVRDWRPDNPLFGLDNVVITPHAAYYSEEAIDTVRRFAAESGPAARMPLSRSLGDGLFELRFALGPTVASALGRHLVVSFPEKVPARLKDAVQVV